MTDEKHPDNHSEKDAAPGVSGRGDLEKTKTYKIGKQTFEVKSVFNNRSKDTIGTILLKLIRADEEIR